MFANVSKTVHLDKNVTKSNNLNEVEVNENQYINIKDLSILTINHIHIWY